MLLLSSLFKLGKQLLMWFFNDYSGRQLVKTPERFIKLGDIYRKTARAMKIELWQFSPI